MTEGQMIGPVGPVSDHIVRIRGIPWSCSKEEILEFFNDVDIKKGLEGIHFVHAFETGKPSGEAYIELETIQDIEKAKKHNMGYINNRYIEVFDASFQEMQHFLNGGGTNGNFKRQRRPENRGPGSQIHFGGTMEYFEEGLDHAYVRLRGLPFNCKEQDLYDFFQGIEIAPHGIKMPLDGKYRSVGEAYIQLATLADADKAMSKHKEKIGHRYIEIFRSTAREFDSIHVEGWVPPPRPACLPRPPLIQWMEGYGPNGMASYPPAPGAAFYGHPWGGPPPGPSGNPYDYRSPPTERDPYRTEYWPCEQYSSSGPIRSHGPPPGRPSPYDRPNSWSGYPNRPPPPPGSNVPPPPPPSNSTVPTAKSSNNFVFVRGLPPHVVEKDIDLFFHVKPTHIKLILDDFERPSEAKVEFGSHEDAVKAMQQDKGMLFDRSVELFLCSKEIPNAPASNGSNQPQDSDSRPLLAESLPKEESPKETPSQVFGSNYSYSVSPAANGSNGSAVSTPTPTPGSKTATPPAPQPSAQQLSAEQQKSYSFYGMVPNGWQAEFTVPKSQPGASTTATSTASYNYAAYGNPYYPYGYNYGPYGAYYGAYGQPTPANPAPAPAAGTIRKEPVNYSAR